MTEYKVRIADNGYIVESDGYVYVYEQHDEIPRRLLEHLLEGLTDYIDGEGVCELAVNVDVKPFHLRKEVKNEKQI